MATFYTNYTIGTIWLNIIRFVFYRMGTTCSYFYCVLHPLKPSEPICSGSQISTMHCRIPWCHGLLNNSIGTFITPDTILSWPRSGPARRDYDPQPDLASTPTSDHFPACLRRRGMLSSPWDRLLNPSQGPDHSSWTPTQVVVAVSSNPGPPREPLATTNYTLPLGSWYPVTRTTQHLLYHTRPTTCKVGFLPTPRRIGWLSGHYAAQHNFGAREVVVALARTLYKVA